MAARAPQVRSAWTYPLHPVLLTAAIILTFWLDTTVSPFAAVRSALIATVGVAALTVSTALLVRNRHLAGVVVSTLVVVMYAKRILYLVEDMNDRMPAWLLLVWVALIGLVVALAARLLLRHLRSWTWPAITSRLNLATALLIVATLGTGMLGGRLVGAVNADRVGAVEVPVASASADGAEPDMYVVLLDGYPRADVLAHFFDYDNRPFLDALEQRGFDVAADSHSDYLWTHVSLSSMLHMEYIEQIEALEPVVEGRAPLHPAIRRAVNRNPAFEFLRERGYRIVTVHSGYEELALRGADEHVDNGSITEFELKLLASTFLGNAIAAVAPDFASASHRDRITDVLGALGEAATTAGPDPQLVFAHVPAPHQPTVFGRDGAPVTVPLNEHFYSDSPVQQGVGTDAWVDGYRDQLDHLNELIIRAVDDILEASVDPPVILLWSDHGSASQVDWVRVQPADADPADLLERTGTLFASLTPDRDGVFPDDITPVNAFRHLFDAYFATDLGAADPPAGGGQIPAVDASVLDDQ